MVESRDSSWLSDKVTDLENAGANLLNAGYEHVKTASTGQLIEEGVSLGLLTAAVVLGKRFPVAPGMSAIGIPVADTAVGEAGLAELGLGRLPANLSEAGLDLRYKVSMNGAERPVTVHVPPGFNPENPTPVYYLLDGVQVNNPAGNMLGINGWARTADARNLVAVNIEQSPQSSLRVWGVPLPSAIGSKEIPNITSWSFDHGLLNPTRGINDVGLFETVHGRMASSMNVGAHNIVTFSDGAPLANAIAAKMPEGSLNGVANVAGTIMKDAPKPQPGIKGFFVNSVHDPTIPIEGGPGPKLTKWMPKLGQRNILKSVPEMQETAYAEANGLQPTPRVTETPVYTQREYVASGEDTAKVKAFRLNKGGHTWPGRDIGDGTNTAFTKANGDTVSHADFPTNNLIVDFFENGGVIKRTLG